MKTITGGVCAPAGFEAAGVAANIKGADADKKDCALVASDAPCVLAGVFTTNVVKAPSVRWNHSLRDARRPVRALFLNSGNANTCTGVQGARDVAHVAGTVAKGLGLESPEAVCVFSTGVIGAPLPMDRIDRGIAGCIGALSGGGGMDAALAIMTTDTVPKEMALEVPLESGAVRIGAMAKGSGMVSPNMATMFGVFTTDAAIGPGPLQDLLRRCVDASFNRICVDNDMSTSDSVVCVANGRAPAAKLEAGAPDFALFAEALEHACVCMAQALVRDGEGATKFIEITVSGAANDADAKTIARSVAVSQLCKTAFFGEDPNWGRIACAAGHAGAPFDPDALGIKLAGLEVMAQGAATGFDEEAASGLMKQRDVSVAITVGAGPGTAVFWTSDLSHDYVTINAEYRT